MTETRSDRPLLDVEDLSISFRVGGEWCQALDRVTFDLHPGEIVGVVGESGSGKSVMSLALMGLLDQRTTRIEATRLAFDGNDLTTLKDRDWSALRGSQMSMIFQEPMTSLNPAFRVGDQIAETVRTHRKISRRDAWKRAVEVLDLVGIPNADRRSRAYPHEFSGGMRQRVMLAIAIACEPRLLIADEPTTALDVTIQAQLLQLMREMRDELHLSALFISHDLGVVSELCDRVVVMYAGRLVESSEVGALFEAPQHPYTEGLLASMPQLRLAGQDVAVIPGRAPSIGAFPSGCRLHPRCPYSEERCTDDSAMPMITGRRGGHETQCIRADELHLEGMW